MGQRVARVLLGLAFFLLGNSTVCAQTEVGSAPQAGRPALEFMSTRFDDLHEGYFSLEWNPVEGAARYEVRDATGDLAYSGALPQAFLSGLADGEYQYHVRAFSASGEVLAVSTEAARAKVQHWSMGLVWTLFFTGLAVVLAVAGVLIAGAVRFGRRGAAA